MAEPRDDAAPAQSDSGPKRVIVLGSTGSIGTNTLDLIGRDPAAFHVAALTANTNVTLLADQARRFGADCAVIADPGAFGALKDALAGTGIEAAAGPEAVVAAAGRPADWVMAAIVGAAGLKPTLAAIRQGATVAFANKECLVCAGPLMTQEVARHGATLLPVDSEHNALFQALDPNHREHVARLILTASGGPFRAKTRDQMAGMTAAQAVAHPTWSMGAKISVDSATMMNKGLEVIEAAFLFDMPSERIDVLVHPQSIVHSLVEYEDGSVLAQLGSPDMRTPIAHTLAWPRRMPTPTERLDLAAIGRLEFEAPDPDRFPALTLTRQALLAGGTVPAVLNAANEVAVAAFLAGRIGFLDIERVVAQTLDTLPGQPLGDLEDVFAVDLDARRTATNLL